MTRPVDWPEKMTREGVTVTREQMERAWKEWRPEFGSFLLASVVRAQAECKQSAANRLADAMIQHARRAGVIRYRKHVTAGYSPMRGAGWEWVE